MYERQSLNLVVESPTAVHPDTVIGAALVSADDGYRVFYYDRDWALQVARYDPKANKASVFPWRSPCVAIIRSSVFN